MTHTLRILPLVTVTAPPSVQKSNEKSNKNTIKQNTRPLQRRWTTVLCHPRVPVRTVFSGFYSPPFFLQTPPPPPPQNGHNDVGVSNTRRSSREHREKLNEIIVFISATNTKQMRVLTCVFSLVILRPLMFFFFILEYSKLCLKKLKPLQKQKFL